MAPSEGISVIIPTLNRAMFIAEAIESVRDNGYPHLDIIVADNGSTDGTLEIVSTLDVRCVGENRRGAGFARIAGLAVAKYETVLFLDSDDVLVYEALTNLFSALESENADFAYGAFENFLDPKSAVPGKAYQGVGQSQLAPISSTTLTTKSAVAKFGPMRGDNVSWPRLMMFARREGAVFSVVPSKVAHRRIHNSNISLNFDTRTSFFSILRDLPGGRANA